MSTGMSSNLPDASSKRRQPGQTDSTVGGSSNASPPTDSSSSSAANLPAVTVPKGGGAVRGMGEKFSVSSATGTASSSIPVPISGSRAGFQPNLSLSYSSGAGSGPFGFGWQLALPSIVRKTDLGLPMYNDREESDTFILSGVEDLVPVLSRGADGNWARCKPLRRQHAGAAYDVWLYRPRVESEFSRIERWMAVTSGRSQWRVLSKSNVTTIFGDNDDCAIFDADRPTHIFQWLISQTFDDRGNAITFEYKRENGQSLDLTKPYERYRPATAHSAMRYPKRVRYGNRVSHLVEPINAHSDWLFEVVFDYGEHDVKVPSVNEVKPWAARSDPFSSYRPGFDLRTYRLCRRILMFHHFPEEKAVGNDCVVSSLEISYHTDGNQRLTGLSTASCVSCFQTVSYLRHGTGYMRQSLPPVQFKYSRAELASEVCDLSPVTLEDLPSGLDASGYQWIDLDGKSAGWSKLPIS